jgi:hypothetical protein
MDNRRRITVKVVLIFLGHHYHYYHHHHLFINSIVITTSCSFVVSSCVRQKRPIKSLLTSNLTQLTVTAVIIVYFANMRTLKHCCSCVRVTNQLLPFFFKHHHVKIRCAMSSTVYDSRTIICRCYFNTVFYYYYY